MMDTSLRPVGGPIDAEVRPPGSKSMTNRALLLAALAHGRSELSGVLWADDTRRMVDSLRSLGVSVLTEDDEHRAVVTGCGGCWTERADLFCGNAGTVARFLSAACCLGTGEYTISGVARMNRRPIGPLVDALRELGASIDYRGSEGFPPLRIAGTGLRGGTVRFDATPSSQFVSAILLSAPLARGDVMMDVGGPLVSAPFVRMTLQLMEQFGAAVVEDEMRRFIVPGSQGYRATGMAIEPDATAASYFFAAAAVTGGRVRVEGLGSGSVQGDVEFIRVLQAMGCMAEQTGGATTIIGPAGGRLNGVDVDLGDMPDVAPTLAVLALFARGPTRIRNVAHLRIKESDRLAALATELGRLGAEIEIHDDGLTIRPPAAVRPSRIETYDDHRMAMSFAAAGLRVDGITIGDAECVEKTYPDFFRDWERMAQES